MYLHRDPENKKFKAHDKFNEALMLARREITLDAKNRFFSLSDLTTARYRFQPHRLHRAPSLGRGAYH